MIEKPGRCEIAMSWQGLKASSLISGAPIAGREPARKIRAQLLPHGTPRADFETFTPSSLVPLAVSLLDPQEKMDIPNGLIEILLELLSLRYVSADQQGNDRRQNRGGNRAGTDDKGTYDL